MMMMVMVMLVADEARTDTERERGRTDNGGARSVILTAPHYSSRVLNRDRQACEWGSINGAAAAASDSGI